MVGRRRRSSTAIYDTHVGGRNASCRCPAEGGNEVFALRTMSMVAYTVDAVCGEKPG